MMRRAHATDPAGPGWQPLLASIQASCPSLSATIANLSTALVDPAAADITTLRRGDFVALCEACVAVNRLAGEGQNRPPQLCCLRGRNAGPV